MLKNRGEFLKYAIANALRGAAKVVRGCRIGLTVTEREAIGERAVAEIRALPDDPWKLGEELPRDWNSVASDAPGYRGGSTPDDWCVPFNEKRSPSSDQG